MAPSGWPLVTPHGTDIHKQSVSAPMPAATQTELVFVLGGGVFLVKQQRSNVKQLSIIVRNCFEPYHLPGTKHLLYMRLQLQGYRMNTCYIRFRCSLSRYPVPGQVRLSKPRHLKHSPYSRLQGVASRTHYHRRTVHLTRRQASIICQQRRGTSVGSRTN